MINHSPDEHGAQPVKRPPGHAVSALLVGSLAVAAVAILLVAGASYFASAQPVKHVPLPTPTPSIYLMTEGALQMEMTALSASAPTKAEIAHVAPIIRQARAVEAHYLALPAAIADGYLTAPDLLVETQGQHYFQPQYLQQASLGQFDPSHPPLLVYHQIQGKTVLSGLLYYMPAKTSPKKLATIVPPSLAGWHRHINLCISGGASLLDGAAILPIHDRADCIAKGGAFSASTGWMVHIWLNQPLGRSLFAMDRPRTAP
jgi:hypothetical protein